ncbi:rhodanese domain protein [Rhodovulum sulfidophilum]|uniref:Rhodanese domain protein n=1 Tax=Rhodovulum sulfidophilum TaxID=35806 RepID=A0A0D6B3Q8_RHOSU|nr:rhodanese domain protein [Rhodovulum sulfidophilum]
MANWFDLMARVYPYIEEIRPKDASIHAEKGELILIDVREAHEVARSGKARGAIHIPLMMIRHKANARGPNFDPALDPAKSFALYCENGSKAIQAARMMKKMGYEDVYNMGSFREWLNAKLPVE